MPSVNSRDACAAPRAATGPGCASASARRLSAGLAATTRSRRGVIRAHDLDTSSLASRSTRLYVAAFARRSDRAVSRRARNASAGVDSAGAPDASARSSSCERRRAFKRSASRAHPATITSSPYSRRHHESFRRLSFSIAMTSKDDTPVTVTCQASTLVMAWISRWTHFRAGLTRRRSRRRCRYCSCRGS